MTPNSGVGPDERSTAGPAGTEPSPTTSEIDPGVAARDAGHPPCPPVRDPALGVPSPPQAGQRHGTSSQLSPGWYPDPWHVAERRAWDGTAWTFEPGWYPDAGAPEGRRYWTGSQWAQQPPTLGARTTHAIPAAQVTAFGVPHGAGRMSAGWYQDPDHAHDPRRQRYWDGRSWTGRRRREPPEAVRWLAPAFFTLLGIATGMTMWPANGASCHEHPPAAYPFSVTATLWLSGVVLALVLIVVSYARWRQVVAPLLILLGAIVLPLAVAVVSAEDCLA